MLVRTREEIFDDTRRKRKSYMRAILRVFPKQACQYIVQDVIWWMEELNCGHDIVTIPAVGDAPQRMWQLKSSPVVHAKAQDVPGEWYGGPHVIKKYKGHLMQLLMDRILQEVNSHGTAHFLAVSKRFKALPHTGTRYNVKYTDVLGTSDEGGKCPFNVP